MMKNIRNTHKKALSMAGFVFAVKSKKEINDDVVKIGLIINPVSIILGGIQIFL